MSSFIGLALAGAVSGHTCLVARTALEAGSVLHVDAFSASPCRVSVNAPYRYDAAIGAVRLTRDLAAGDVVAQFAERSGIAPGDKLRLIVAAGPVQVERDVVALQSAHPGGRLFVRAADGEVLSVQYEDLAP